MKKIIQYFIIIIVIGVLLMGCLSLYVGNYVYDYTLNPHSQDNISKNIQVDEEKAEKSYQWLDENSQDVYIQSDDKVKLHAYSIQQNSHIYMIMVHGYRSDASGIISPIKKMKKQHYNLIIPSLRGHGKSEGDYIGMGWNDRLDIIKWIDYILKRDLQASIVLYGVSMGGATVMNVAGEKLPSQVKCVIEDCGYTSVWEVFKNYTDMNELESEIALQMASLTTWIRAGYRLEEASPIDQVKKSQIPILFIHGDQDTFVPYKMVNELYDAAHCPKEKLIIHGAGHASSYAVDAKKYYQTIFDFMRKYV